MENNQAVVRNYGREGLAAAILAHARRLAAAGQLTFEHLSLYDQFHLGGRFATERVALALAVAPEAPVLDVGSGIGGPARQVAAATGARVTGVDLTPQHVEAATELSERVGMAGQTGFRLGDATRLPLPDGAFDAAMMLFVGMNVPDKRALFREVRRVMQPKGRYVVYDPMRPGEAHPEYPVPWAADRGSSYLETPEHYRAALAAAGFQVESEEDLLDEVRRVAAQQEAGEAPGQQEVIGLQFGDEGPTRFTNLVEAVKAGVVVPRLMVARAV